MSEQPGEPPLTAQELQSIVARWTARSAQPGKDHPSLMHQFNEAQSDLGRVLRHLGAFNGPPVQQ